MTGGLLVSHGLVCGPPGLAAGAIRLDMAPHVLHNLDTHLNKSPYYTKILDTNGGHKSARPAAHRTQQLRSPQVLSRPVTTHSGSAAISHYLARDEHKASQYSGSTCRGEARRAAGSVPFVRGEPGSQTRQGESAGSSTRSPRVGRLAEVWCYVEIAFPWAENIDLHVTNTLPQPTSSPLVSPFTR
jgi:hypothetical protein